MKRSYTTNLYCVLSVVILLLVYPIENSSANATSLMHAKEVKKIATIVTQPLTETLHSELLFK